MYLDIIYTVSVTTLFSTVDKVVVQPWKCWGDLAVRAAVKASTVYHDPVVMSACWYLDYDTDWASFLSTDLISTAIASVLHSDHDNHVKYTDSIESGSDAMRIDSISIHDKNYFGGEGESFLQHYEIY
jgi:hypothetical protein